MKQTWVVIVCCLASFQLLAKQRIDETVDADPQGYVEIKNTSGVIEVKSWDKNQVKVVGTLDKYVEDVEFVRTGNQVKLHIKVPKNKVRHGYDSDDGDDLTVYLPLQSHVSYISVNSDFKGENYAGGTDISLVNGDVSLTAIQGRIRVNTVNGDIDSRQLSGDIQLETINGDIKDNDSSGQRFSVTTVNGDVKATSSVTSVKLEAVNGDLDVNLGKVNTVEANTVNGEISIGMQLAEHAEVNVNSVSGRIHLGFVQPLSARFNVVAHSGGKLLNTLTRDKEQRAKYGPRRSLEFSVGKGEARVDVSTVSGKVTIAEK